jgi:hypothetical protein
LKKELKTFADALAAQGPRHDGAATSSANIRILLAVSRMAMNAGEPRADAGVILSDGAD